MRLNEIIYPEPLPSGSLGATIFKNYFYLDVDVRSESIYFTQKKVLVQVKILKKW